MSFVTRSRLLECLFVLLSTPATASQSAIFVAVRSIIRTLLHTQEGLLFLSTRPDTTNGIIRSLVQMTVSTFVSAIFCLPSQSLALISYCRRHHHHCITIIANISTASGLVGLMLDWKNLLVWAYQMEAFTWQPLTILWLWQIFRVTGKGDVT